MKLRILLIRWWANDMIEKSARQVAWWMPRWLAYWCAIRVIAHATVGQYSNTIVPELRAMDALQRWEK